MDRSYRAELNRQVIPVATKVLMPKKAKAYQGRGMSNDDPKIPDRAVNILGHDPKA